MTTLAPEAAHPAHRFQAGMHVDRTWRDHPDLTSREYGVLVAVTSMCPGGSRRVVARLSTIARKLGRGGDRAGDQISRDLARLEQAGALKRSRTRRGAGVTELHLAQADGLYNVHPWPLVRALEAGELPVEALRTWAHLEQRMGWNGWTSDSNSLLATAAGASTRTIARHLQQLENAGLLERSTGSARVITRAEATPPHHITIGVKNDLDCARSAHDTDAGTHDTDAGSIDLPPEALPPVNSPSSRSARYLSKSASQATSGRKRPEGGIYSKPGISEVRDLLETVRQWRYGERKAWQARILTVATPHLEAGMAPEVVAHALAVRAEVEIDEAIELMQSPLAAVAAGLKALAIDIRLGQACRDCGRDAVEAQQTALAGGRCDWCTNDRFTTAVDPVEPEIPAEVLEEVRRHLSPSPTPLESATPEPISSDEGSLTEQSHDPAPGQEPIENTLSTADSISDWPCASTSTPEPVPSAVGANCRHRAATHSSQRLHPRRRLFVRASQASAVGAGRHDRRLARPP